jgi:hypothetical protein
MPADHEEGLAGQDNYVHALVRNNGPNTATNILLTWHIMDYPGTELIYPVDWNAGNLIASALIPSLAPSTEVAVEALWPMAKVNIAAGYVHPCMVVAATCAQDVGGQLGSYVYQYNNIAQHNISIAPAPMFRPGFETFTMPFAVGNRQARARKAVLAFDTSELRGARAYLDLRPDPEDVYVRRIVEQNQDRGRADAAHGCCALIVSMDTRVLVQCRDYKAEMVLKSGSALKLPCGCDRAELSREDVTVAGAHWTRLQTRDVIALSGRSPHLEIPLEPGVVIPMAMIVVPPADGRQGDRYALHVTQISEGIPTGGVSLRVEAKQI